MPKGKPHELPIEVEYTLAPADQKWAKFVNFCNRQRALDDAARARAAGGVRKPRKNRGGNGPR